jgi:ribosomal protein S18 acetylase RimI-like enzyme
VQAKATMSDQTRIPLTPTPVELDSAELKEICSWQYPDAYFGRLLQGDIPQRVLYFHARIWVYRDPDKRLVGFGTIDVCNDYELYTAGEPHPYIPLLAVHPSSAGLGHGTSIVQHLIAEAVILERLLGCHNALFLDVYADNERAIRLYERPECGFKRVETIPDPDENGRPLIIMSKGLSVVQ